MTGIVATALALPTSATAQGVPFENILAQLATLSAQIDALAATAVHDVYVPFNVQIPGGLCDSGPSPSSNPEIHINSDGTDTFVVTSILVKRAFMNPVDFTFFSVNTVTIDGTSFDTRTGNLFEPIGGEFGVLQGADILGTPVRPQVTSDQTGGNVPHQIVANGDGGDDIRIRLFCRSDDQDMNLETILVAGWKQPVDTMSVTYLPGN